MLIILIVHNLSFKLFDIEVDIALKGIHTVFLTIL